MDFKYIKNIVEEEATILLYDQIGDSVDENGMYKSGISGSSFAYEMQYLQDKCKKINVRINSIGGNVLDGYSIVSAILNSKIKCDTARDNLRVFCYNTVYKICSSQSPRLQTSSLKM